jgi:hypothetical protein
MASIKTSACQLLRFAVVITTCLTKEKSLNRLIAVALLVFFFMLPGTSMAADAADFLVGTYENHLYDKSGKNDWHYVEITKVNATQVRWTNRAKATWTLTVDPKDKTKAMVGADSPYFAQGYKVANLTWNNASQIISIEGPGKESYQRVLAVPRKPVISAGHESSYSPPGDVSVQTYSAPASAAAMASADASAKPAKKPKKEKKAPAMASAQASAP